MTRDVRPGTTLFRRCDVCRRDGWCRSVVHRFWTGHWWLCQECVR